MHNFTSKYLLYTEVKELIAAYHILDFYASVLFLLPVIIFQMFLIVFVNIDLIH